VSNHLIEHSDVGVAIAAKTDRRESKEFRWSDVNRVLAYKRDCITVDLICLAIGTPADAVEVDEEMEGWTTLVAKLPTYLPGCLAYEQWFAKVAFPAFETNTFEIFRR
jgi:hypothetical protein